MSSERWEENNREKVLRYEVPGEQPEIHPCHLNSSPPADLHPLGYD